MLIEIYLKNMVENYHKFIQNTLDDKYDAFIISLKNNKILDDNNNFNYEKVRFSVEQFSNAMHNLMRKKNIDTEIFMKNAVIYYDLCEDMSLLVMICAYYELIYKILPMHILIFAVDKNLLRYFLEIFIDGSRTAK